MALPIVKRKLQRNVEDYGFWTTAHKVVARLFGPLCTYRVYRIYRFDLTLASSRQECDLGCITFKVLESTDCHIIDQIEDYAEWLRGTVASRLKAGELCLVALHRDQLAGFNLIAFGQVTIPLVSLERTFRPADAWSVQIAVHRDFRRRGLASQIRYRVCDELRNRGIKRFYGGARRSNLPSLRLARTVGFREIVDIHYGRLLILKKWQCRRVRA